MSNSIRAYWVVVAVVFAAVLVVVGVVLGGIGAAATPAGPSNDELKAAFDQGKKAGVEYEQWFCSNTVSS